MVSVFLFLISVHAEGRGHNGTLNEYIHEKHGMNISVSNSVHQPSAMDKNLNTDCTENTDLAFSLIF